MKLMRLAAAAMAACVAATSLAQIKWAPSYPAALKQAKASNKLLMVEFFAPWDQWSSKLSQDTLSQPGAQGVAAKTVPVRLNVEKEGKDLGQKYHVTNYPTVLFLDKNEEVVGVIDGYETADEFVKHGNTFIKDTAALPGYEAKYRANSKDLDAIVHIGSIYALRYQMPTALAKLAEAEKIDPSNRTDKLSDLYNDIADYYQNASQYDPAIKYFQKTVDTSKSTDKKAYGYLSIAACYFSMDTPSDPSAIDEKLVAKVRDHFRKAKEYVDACLKLPNLKKEDRDIAENDKTQINRVIGG